MKNSIFLSSLLAVCVTCVAHADDVVQDGVYEITSAGTTTTIDGNLTANFLRIDINKNSTLVVNGDTVINSDRDCPRGSDNQYNPNYLASGSTIETSSLTVNYDTNHAFSKGFTIQGTLKTDSFIVNSTEKSTCSVTITNGGSLESLSSDKGTLTIGENVKLNVGNPSASASGSIRNMNTVIDGGSLKVQYYAAMDGITLNSGSIEIINYPDPNASHIKPVDSPIDLGDIIVNEGTFSLNEAAIVSDVTMNSGKLNIIGDVETGALTLNGGTINFDADATIDLGEESLILGDNVAITLNVDSLDDTDGVTLFKTTGNVSGLDELTVTFMDATGATKEAAVSFSNGSVVTGTIPEPTTATLSLLALVGLAARRRRK